MPGWVPHVFLTRPPRSTPEGAPVRLACIRHAASVVPEPGSNSPSRSPLTGFCLPGLCNSINTASRFRDSAQSELRESIHTLYELRFSCQGACGETKPARKAGGNTSSALSRFGYVVPAPSALAWLWSEPLPACQSLTSIFNFRCPVKDGAPPIFRTGRLFRARRPWPTRGNHTTLVPGVKGNLGEPDNEFCITPNLTRCIERTNENDDYACSGRPV